MFNALLIIKIAVYYSVNKFVARKFLLRIWSSIKIYNI